MARPARRPHLHAGPRARSQAARPPARSPARPLAHPVPAAAATAASQAAPAARGQRQRRPAADSRASPHARAGSPLRRSPPRAPPSAPGSRYLLTRAARSSTTKMAAGGGAQRRAGAGQAWRERLEPIQRAAARRAARWPAARPRPPGHLQGGGLSPRAGARPGGGACRGAPDSLHLTQAGAPPTKFANSQVQGF